MSNLISSSATRIKTGFALLFVAFAIGYIDSYFIMWLLFGGLLVVALSEAMVLLNIKSSSIYFYTGILWFVAYFYPNPEDLLFLLVILLASVLAYTKNLDKNLFILLLYPTASFLFLLSLYNEFGMASLLWLLALVAGTDVGAYFVGKSIGKTKFCETSPNKTLEGVVGGVVFATLLGIFFAIDGLSTVGATIVSLLVSASSIFGDLFESYLKREAGVKDSGNILPGHGGILDRTDGYLFGGVVMLIILRAII